MSDQIQWVELAVFIFFFALVTVMGFFAARWKAVRSTNISTNGVSADGSSVPGSPGFWSAAISTPRIP